MNTQFKVSLTPEDDKPFYTQRLSVPINLKEDLTVETNHYVPLRGHHDTARLKRHKPHLCATETQRQAETTGGFAEDQRPQFR